MNEIVKQKLEKTTRICNNKPTFRYSRANC